jgi:hypothetical protein
MQPLPYRADPADVRRYLLAIARGRTPQQLRENEFASKTLDGVSSAAEVLGLTDGKNGGLSAIGRRFAMATGEGTQGVAAEVLLSYAPYARLIEAMRDRPGATSLELVQAWWAEHGFGSSDSNRNEAAPVLARFVEAAGLGRYVQGRKGRTSRIEWHQEPGDAEIQSCAAAGEGARNGTDASSVRESDRRSASAPPGNDGRTRAQANRLSWELTPGRRMRLELPSELSDDERRFALRVISLLLGRD